MPSTLFIKRDPPSKNKIKSITVREFSTRFILLCIMPLVLLALVLAVHHVYLLQKQYDSQAWTKTRNVLMSIDRDLSARISSLEVLAKSPLLDSPPRMDEFYKEAQGFRESFTGHVILADTSTQMIINTRVPLGSTLPKLPVPKGFAAAQHVLRTGMPAVGDMFLGPIAKEPLIAIVVPVVRSGETQALVLSIIETRQYQNILDGLELPKGYSVAILDSNKAVMANRVSSSFNKTSILTEYGRKYSQNSKVAHWEVVLEVDPWIYNRTLFIEAAGLMMVVIMVALTSILGGRMMGKKLACFIESLSGERKVPASTATISEIEVVRDLLAKASLDKEQSMKELRTNEMRYRTLFEAANVGKSIAFPNGEVKVNKAFCQMLGYEEGELVGKTWQELTAKDEIEHIQNILDQLMKGEKDSARFEKRYIHKDGSYVWGDVSIAIQRDHDGNVLYFIATIVDIRKRKKMEDVLRESEEKYRLLFENMTDGFALHEIITDEQNNSVDFKFSEINPAVERHTCLKKADLIGKSLKEVEALSSWEDKYVNVATTGSPVIFQEFSPSLKKWFDVIVFKPIPGKCATIFSDVSERINLEKQVRQSQKMEAIGQLAGGVAHDFNNMLSVILGFTEIAMERLDPSSEIYSDLNEVLKASNRSIEITHQLLAFARKQSSEPKAIDLNKAIEGLLKMIRRLIGEDVELVWEQKENLWIVNIDPSQIDQILINLCVNARDSIDNTGTIIIESENISFDNERRTDQPIQMSGDYVMLAVSDNGSGMNAETLERIFEPFFTTKMVGKGTGLGLATVYGIVKQNNGFINVYSEPGSGTTFKIYFPRHEANHECVVSSTLYNDLRAKGETILIVEDEKSILHLAKLILEDLGYKVLSAESPDLAISIARSFNNRIDLVLTDVIMPKMNGREVADNIKSIHPEAEILFMSGYTADIIGHRGVLDKGVQFVSKPLSRQVLAVKIREILGKNS